MENFKKELIPEQVLGSKMDTIEESEQSTAEEAIALFQASCQRMLNINEWRSYAGISDFQLFDGHGVKLNRAAQMGDYIRIDIPGPGTNTGRGYDWVQVELISEAHDPDEEILAMQVRPTEYPLSDEDVTAHFLKKEATSTFVIRRQGKTVFAEEHGRNEMANIDDGSLLDRSRNLIVGLAAKLGLSYPQWKSLVMGLLNG